MSKLKKKSSEIVSFVDLLSREYLFDHELRSVDKEKRADKRIAITMPVVVSPLDEDFWPLDYRVHAVTRNISQSGVSCVCNKPVQTKFVSITFNPASGEEIRVIAKVTRTEEDGHYYQVDSQFIAE